MKTKLAAALVVTLTVYSVIPAVSLQQGFSAMTNGDVLMMVKAKLPTDVIIEKINTSDCNFDTFPSVLAELKYRGVPDQILMAMIKAPHGSRKLTLSTGNSSPAATKSETASTPMEVTIPDGTSLEVESTFTVSSAEVEEGSAVSFTVVHPVKVNGLTVIRAGARATARVTKAKKGGSWGRAGQLAWMMQDVVAVDGSKVPLEFTKSTKGDSKGGTVTTGIVVTGLLFWPAAPFWGFKKGKDAKVPAGRRFDVAVHGNTTVKAIPEQTDAK